MREKSRQKAQAKQRSHKEDEEKKKSERETYGVTQINLVFRYGWIAAREKNNLKLTQCGHRRQ